MNMTRNQAIAALKAKLDAQRGARALEVVAAPALQPQELFLQVGRKRYQVASIAQAVEMHNDARDASEHGASKFPRVTIVNAHGAHLYGISYNGRVWDGDKPLDGMDGDQWVKHVTGVSCVS
jgi:hypothetical protein